MPSPLDGTTHDNGSPLLSIPNEIILEIFCCLSSFSQVFAFAATSRRIRRVWLDHASRVYHQVAPRCIPGEPHARKFREIQRRCSIRHSHLSNGDTICITRNAQIVEKAIVQFENEVVCNVKAPGYDLAKFYGAGARRHPPRLTGTERRRFIRSYYQTWGLLRSDSAGVQRILESTTLKQLYQLYEMCELLQNIGRDEVLPSLQNTGAAPTSGVMLTLQRPKARKTVQSQIWKRLQHVSKRVRNEHAEDVTLYAKEDGFLFFVVIWDHWQPTLKEMVCGRQLTDPSPDVELEKTYLWDDSSDEEA
ncbi:uncharacterized protein N7459_003423 [Penicillium hispanicum]|uniref:uncharacterized protein n=1 Tax=Penicillium hispanicum TaxID=1080232 RepID=UPI002541B2D6|nr:uncharacterized protein N7459_003423 [Penicillium hispanicum]KAJ5587658.1 hypothetical protein N7459_003423 [Penicillium hispanicum]